LIVTNPITIIHRNIVIRFAAAGSSFDDFLQEEGMLVEAEEVAVKRVIAFQLEETMAKEHISKTEMTKRMNTSRSAINRLLDPLTRNDRECSSSNGETTSN
jgi:hypothetical protein